MCKHLTFRVAPAYPHQGPTSIYVRGEPLGRVRTCYLKDDMLDRFGHWRSSIPGFILRRKHTSAHKEKERPAAIVFVDMEGLLSNPLQSSRGAVSQRIHAWTRQSGELNTMPKPSPPHMCTSSPPLAAFDHLNADKRIKRILRLLSSD